MNEQLRDKFSELTKEINPLVNAIQDSMGEFTEKMNPIANAIQDSMERMKPVIETINASAEKFRQQYLPAIEQFFEMHGPKFAELARLAKEWQENRKIRVTEMAEYGWFPNWFTFDFRPEEDETLDDFMIGHIDQCWDDLTQRIIKFCPNRKHILKVAFDLLEQGNYIASVPLLIIQADGICSEEFTYFFTKDNQTGNKASDEIICQAESGELVVSIFSDILLEPFKVDLQISKGSSRASKAAKEKGPNRHGIIHGSRKHLDYGSKVNGYKAVSFLAFIVYALKDEFKKT